MSRYFVTNGRRRTLMQQAVALGVKTARELAAAETAFQQAGFTVLILQQQQEQERLALNRTLGLPPNRDVPLQANSAPPAWHTLPATTQLLEHLEARRLDLVALPFTRLFDVFVGFPAATILPLGIFVKGGITLTSHDALVVLRAAVLPRDDHDTLFTVKNHRGQAHRVQVGIGDRIEVGVIGSDLVPGDLVVVLGNYELHDGMAVTMETGK